MASEVKTNNISPATGTSVTFSGLNVGSDAAGDVLYNDGTDYTRLAKPGTPADEVLTFATGATAPSWVAAAGGGLNSVQKPASGTWSRPAGITKVIVEVQGGGAGGAGANATSWEGGNGGGGSYVKQFIDVSSISSATIVVGAGGGGGGNAVLGTAGGTSSWSDGTNTISCLGGAIGEVSVANPQGGAGGVATAAGAHMIVNGQNGGLNRGDVQQGQSNQGGDSFLGLGGMNSYEVDGLVGTGNPGSWHATGYGAGGAGGCGRYYQGGGNGADGVVIVWEYK
jgi:hypothetical protein